MVFALHEMHYTPSAIQIAGFAVLCCVGIMIHYCLMFLLASISFWTVRAQGIVWGYYNLFNIARMPDDAFRGTFRIVFTFVLPMLLVSNVPARVLADKLDSPRLVFLLLGMCAACLVVSELGWRRSLRRYTSASS
jgi:ABC-2 type transport system permease protein